MKKEKKKYTGNGQILLLEAIVQNYGGNTSVARLLGVTHGIIANWKRIGYIPLKTVGKVSRTLEVPLYALNYSGLAELLDARPEWEEIVRDCDLSSLAMNTVLQGKPPDGR